MTHPSTSTPATLYPTGLGAIADGTALVVMDLWGCMHDGVTVYPAALDVLERLKARGIPVALVSNAPRRAAIVATRLGQMGIPPDLYAGLYTSGEMIWQHLAARSEPGFRDLGAKVHVIGAQDDPGFFAGTGCEPAPLADADFVLVFGVAGETVRLEDFAADLAAARARDLPLVCANPDLVVHRGGIEEICAGAIAEAYRETGGRVLIEGKPYPGVYRRALADLGLADLGLADPGNADRGRVLGIGDALRTDVAGAAGIGARSLLIAGGIHHAELLRDGVLDRGALARLVAGKPQPTYALAYLAW